MASPDRRPGPLVTELMAALGTDAGTLRLSAGGDHPPLDAPGVLRSVVGFAGWLESRQLGRPRVLLRGRNSTGLVTALLGIMLAGGVPLLLDPLTSDAQHGELIAGCGADLLLDDVSAGPLAGPRAPLADDDRGRYRVSADETAPTGHRVTRVENRHSVPDLAPDTELCRFTSGSTRTPAAIEFSGAAVLAAARSWIAVSALGESDRVLCFAGLYNGLAFNTSLIPGLLARCSLTVPSGLPTRGYVSTLLATVQPTVLVAFPAIYEALRERGPLDGTAQLRLSLSSAAPLSTTTATVLATRDHLRISDYYGLAETGPVTLDRNPGADGGLGRPLPHAEVAFDDDGQILVRTPSMGTRYLNYPGEFAARLTADGFYRSGDAGELREGRLHLLGRIGAGINIDGRKISGLATREALLTHPAVRDCHVLGVADDAGHPVLGALIVVSPAVTAAELRGWCLSRLTPYEVPSRILFAESIPRSGSGKPQLHRIEDAVRALIEKDQLDATTTISN